jgi:SAM-dependent methyltransferase
MPETTTVAVHPSNRDAQQAWDGGDGAYWVEHEERFDESLTRYRRPFLDAAAITAGDRVLDVGCGTGQSTRDAARLAAPGAVLGVDLSSAMVERARRRGHDEGLGNARFLQADVQIHPFAETFDVALSRTGAMFFGEPDTAFANIARALRPGGRLALMAWQPLARNEWVREWLAALAAGRDLPGPAPDAPGPFSLSDPDRVRRILDAAGFTEVGFSGVEELMYFGRDIEDTERFVCGQGLVRFLLRDLDDTARTRALEDLHASIAAHDTGSGVWYPAAAWMITALRR